MSEENGKKLKLSPEKKFQIYQECSAPNAPVGEILRRYGLYPNALTQIRHQVEAGALKELGRNRYKKKSPVAYEQYAKLLEEKQAQESALAQLTQEYLLLKKRVS